MFASLQILMHKLYKIKTTCKNTPEFFCTWLVVLLIKRHIQICTDHNSSCSTETGGLPHNLPKKQRELFLRIQQQQREAADSSSHDQSGEDDGKDEEVEQQQSENWYSSDEEEASLADVLKNLSKQVRCHMTQSPVSIIFRVWVLVAVTDC